MCVEQKVPKMAVGGKSVQKGNKINNSNPNFSIKNKIQKNSGKSVNILKYIQNFVPFMRKSLIKHKKLIDINKSKLMI